MLIRLHDWFSIVDQEVSFTVRHLNISLAPSHPFMNGIPGAGPLLTKGSSRYVECYLSFCMERYLHSISSH